MGTRIRWVIEKTLCVPSSLSDPCKATRNMSGDHFTVYITASPTVMRPKEGRGDLFHPKPGPGWVSVLGLCNNRRRRPKLRVRQSHDGPAQQIDLQHHHDS